MCYNDLMYSFVGYAVIGVATPAALVMMFSIVCHIAVSALRATGFNKQQVEKFITVMR